MLLGSANSVLVHLVLFRFIRACPGLSGWVWVCPGPFRSVQVRPGQSGSVCVHLGLFRFVRVRLGPSDGHQLTKPVN